jgi:hypothetical protein
MGFFYADLCFIQGFSVLCFSVKQHFMILVVTQSPKREDSLPAAFLISRSGHHEKSWIRNLDPKKLQPPLFRASGIQLMKRSANLDLL